MRDNDIFPWWIFISVIEASPKCAMIALASKGGMIRIREPLHLYQISFYIHEMVHEFVKNFYDLECVPSKIAQTARTVAHP